MIDTARFVVACWGASLRSALEYRAAFVVQALFMALNNLIFLGFWAVFFSRFSSVRGWDLSGVALLYGVAAIGFGIGVVLFGGVLDLGRRVASGQVDTWLLRPRPVFLQAGVSSMQVSGFGDLASGVLLFALSGKATPERVVALVAAALIAATVFASFALLVQSLTFHAPGSQDFAQQAIYTLVTFALYPPSLFGGATRWLLFLVLPAGLMSYLPTELVLDWSWPKAGLLALGAGALLCVTALAWRWGLSRYESGNLVQAE